MLFYSNIIQYRTFELILIIQVTIRILVDPFKTKVSLLVQKKTLITKHHHKNNALPMLLHKRNFGIEINKKISTFSLKQTYHLKNEQINSSLVLSSNFYYLFKLVEISVISPKISSECYSTNDGFTQHSC